MKTIHRILSGAFLLVLVFLSLRSAQAQAPLYVVTDLGTLDGGTHSYGFGINNGGQVTGYSVLSNGTEHAALFSAGSIPQIWAACSPEARPCCSAGPSRWR